MILRGEDGRTSESKSDGKNERLRVNMYCLGPGMGIRMEAASASVHSSFVWSVGCVLGDWSINEPVLVACINAVWSLGCLGGWIVICAIFTFPTLHSDQPLIGARRRWIQSIDCWASCRPSIRHRKNRNDFRLIHTTTHSLTRSLAGLRSRFAYQLVHK